MRVHHPCFMLLIVLIGASLLAGCMAESQKADVKTASTDDDRESTDPAIGPDEGATTPDEAAAPPEESDPQPNDPAAQPLQHPQNFEVEAVPRPGLRPALPPPTKAEPNPLRVRPQPHPIRIDPGKGGPEPSAVEPPSPEPPRPAAIAKSGPFEPAARDPGPDDPASEPAEPDGTSEPQKDYSVVQVFFGTDRAAVRPGDPEKSDLLWWLSATAIAALVAAILAAAILRFSETRPKAYWIVLAALVPAVPGFMAANAALAYVRATSSPNTPQLAFGREREERLELGTCRVSIPKCHEPGELESPQIWRLEVLENPKRHVAVLDVTTRPTKEFYAELGQRVQQSQQQAAFVFVHGFNVSFKEAACRTAQMAHDLHYDGAPIFYSWPSQGGSLPYSVDEANVDWTVPHLKEFLVGIAQQSGARRVHLIAHSMGNRALTAALREFSFLSDETRPLFHEVVLTAPDIDAGVFKNQIAPAIVRMAERTTLYASSKDWALYASKKVHGYPRAGEAGEGLLVLPGIDTVDASAVDTSFIGHSYVADSTTVLADLTELLHRAKPPDQRTWLRPRDRGPLRYWVFQPN